MTALKKINFDNSDRLARAGGNAASQAAYSTPTSRHRFNSMILDCLGCKWTILLMDKIAAGVNRPGKLVKTADGLTTKVLNQCLNRMIGYQILEKKSFAEIPPRVEYHLTPFGLELKQLFLEIQLLQSKYF